MRRILSNDKNSAIFSFFFSRLDLDRLFRSHNRYYGNFYLSTTWVVPFIKRLDVGALAAFSARWFDGKGFHVNGHLARSALGLDDLRFPADRLRAPQAS